MKVFKSAGKSTSRVPFSLWKKVIPKGRMRARKPRLFIRARLTRRFARPSPGERVMRELTACVPEGGNKMLEVFLVLLACMVENVITNLTLKNFLGCKRLHKENRIVVGNDKLERVRIGQLEPLGQVQLVAVFMASSIEPCAVVDAD